MYGLRVYITPDDILAKLSNEDKERFNQCVITDVEKDRDGSVNICCIVFHDSDPYVEAKYRQRYFDDSELNAQIPAHIL